MIAPGVTAGMFEFPMPALSEDLFRALLSVAFLALAVLWCRAFLRAGMESRSFFSRQEGLAAAILFRLLLAASMAGIGAYVARPALMEWSHVPLPMAARCSGALLCALALLLFQAAQRALGRDFSPSPRVKRGSVLVTTGPYRAVRHPMYVTFLASWIGYGLMAANWFIGATGIVAECVIMFVRTPKEEAMLAAAFGSEWARYCQSTGRFLPRWNRTS